MGTTPPRASGLGPGEGAGPGAFAGVIVEAMMAAIGQFVVTAAVFVAGMAWFGLWTWMAAVLVALAGFVAITWLAARGRVGPAMLVPVLTVIVAAALWLVGGYRVAAADCSEVERAPVIDPLSSRGTFALSPDEC